MHAFRHQLFLKFFDEEDHSPLTQARLERVDWQPAIEAALFESAIEGCGASAIWAAKNLRIEPVWHSEVGQPFVEKFRLEFQRPDSSQFTKELSASFFDSTATRLAKTLVEEGKLDKDAHFKYLVCAYPRNGGGTVAARGEAGPVVEELPFELPLHPGSLSEFEARASRKGPAAESALKVFIPQRVLDEVGRLSLDADTVEVGGILLGRLYRDIETSEVFLEITAQVKAPHIVSEKNSVRFTPETWAAVRNVIRLRGGIEEYVAWYHSHPAKYWCNSECSPEAKKNCPLSQPFFSDKDCLVHRVTFPRAYSVALLCTNTFEGLRFALFGWNDGVLSQRGFHILDAAESLNVSENPTVIGGQENAESCE